MKALHLLLVLSMATAVMAGIWDHRKCLAFCRPNKPNMTGCKEGCDCHPFIFLPRFVGACLDPSVKTPLFFRRAVSSKVE
ncbi:hypothetical protein V5799_017522 [Amblyomma americanum]|uniref:Secreted protein n=1 Tax=Amblyomma americanum TaxID=6943 RepID=A0AAQ4F352_AMBAM